MTEKKFLLSFCVPTYNRSDILSEALADLIPKIASYGFAIFVSDNASADTTSEVVEFYQKKYSNIFYHRHIENCGSDRNFEYVLKEAGRQSEYTWLLGDSYRVIEDELTSIVTVLKKRLYPLVVVNAFDRLKSVSSRIYDNSSELLENIGWHMTMMSTLIFSQKIIEQDKFSRYYNTNFIHLGVVFEYLSKEGEKEVYFHSNNSVFRTLLPKIEDSWLPYTFKVFAKNWTEFVFSLPPSIPVEIKLSCIKKHNIKMKIFSIRKLCFLKKKGWLKYEEDVLPYKEYITYATITPWFLVSLISRVPYPLVVCMKWAMQLYERVLMFVNKEYRKARK